MMRPLSYASVCSGIEAATVAWHPLGFLPIFFSEIEAFPCAVLAHHYPDVPNWGDMTRFKEWPDAVFNVLVGGTPCQSFSIAGLRKGLADPRGNLALTYLAIADRYRPEWVAWENVPGVFSSWTGDQPPGNLVEGQQWESTETSDFGGFIAALSELGYGVAWRVLDAQYVRVDGFLRAVPQRRERVIVIGHSSGDWRRAAAVLFDAESLRGNSPPRRESGERPAGPIKASAGRRSGVDEGERGGLIASISPPLNAGGSRSPGTSADTVEALIPVVANTLTARMVKGVNTTTDEGQTMIPVAHSLRPEGYDASEDGSGRGTPIIPVYARGVAATLTRGAESAGKGGYAGRRQEDDANLVAHATAPPLTSNPYGDHESRDGLLVACCDVADSLTVGANQTTGFVGDVIAHDVAAFDLRGREAGAQFEGPHETANIRAASGGSSRSYVAEQWAVRRLTPTECLRLQGFPDDYLDVIYRGKPATDGVKYKALGNSFAVNVFRWLGQRIQMVDGIK